MELGAAFDGWVDGWGCFRTGCGSRRAIAEDPAPAEVVAAATDLPGDSAARGSIFFRGSLDRSSSSLPSSLRLRGSVGSIDGSVEGSVDEASVGDRPMAPPPPTREKDENP